MILDRAGMVERSEVLLNLLLQSTRMSPASADKILGRRSPRPTLPIPWRKVFLRAGTQRRTPKRGSRQGSQPTPSKSRSLRIS
jgi:hypothetical protein